MESEAAVEAGTNPSASPGDAGADAEGHGVVKLWWHVYGTEASGLAEDPETGEPSPSWVTVVAGDSPAEPSEVKDLAVAVFGTMATYRGSYDHKPSEAEKELWTPDEYIESDELLAEVIALREATA
jgi:hypothetical protein